jgi:hypothetical protein
MAYRLLLFDLDGTLLAPDRTLRSDALAVLRTLMSRGVRVGVATGRSRTSARPFVEVLAPDGPLVHFNGALLWDPGAARVVFRHTLPRPDALCALQLAADLGLHANLYIDEAIHVAHRGAESRASELKDGVGHVETGPLATFLDGLAREAQKILLIGEPARLPVFEERLRAATATTCTIVNSEPTYLEILPPGVTKGAALGPIHDHFGIAPADVVAFGDGLNDLELVRDAGLGVAMGNAHPAVKAAARAVIGPHDEDAIARFLCGLFDLPAP